MFLQIIRAHNGLNSSQHRWAFYLPVQVQILHILTARLHVEKTNSSMTSRMTYGLIVKPNKYLVSVPKRLFSSASSFARSVVILTFCVMVGSSY
jgi:hypothetical protein